MSELTIGKHGDKGRYVTADNGSQFFLTKSGEIGQTGKSIDGGARPKSKPPTPATQSNQPAGQPSAATGPAASSKQFPLSDLPARIRDALLKWSADASEIVRPIGWSKLGAERAHEHRESEARRIAAREGREHTSAPGSLGEAVREAMLKKWNEVAGPGGQNVRQSLASLKEIADNAKLMGVDVSPFIRENKLIPRHMAAKMKPNPKMFDPVADDDRFSADRSTEATTDGRSALPLAAAIVDRFVAQAAGLTVEEYAARKLKNSLGQMSLWDDPVTESNLLRSSARQKTFDWDESKVNRDAEGKFAEKGESSSLPAKAVEAKEKEAQVDPESKVEEPKVASETDQQGQKNAPGVHASIIPSSVAYNAHRGTSFVPDERARQVQAEFVSTMNEKYDHFSKLAKTDQQKAVLEEAWPEFLSRAKSAYMAMLSARSNVMSAMIAGPARFPTARNEKKSDTYEKRVGDYLEGLQKGTSAVLRKMGIGLSDSIRIGDKGSGSELEKKLEQLEKFQESAKKINAAVRKVIESRSRGDGPIFKKGFDLESGVKFVMEASGINEKAARSALEPDFAGRYGVPDYALKNNNANMKRVREQIAKQKQFEKESESAASGEKETEFSFQGGNIHFDYDDNRIRIKHDKKPDRSVIDSLKRSGWRWSPSNSAWQRQLTPAAKESAASLTGASFSGPSPSRFNFDQHVKIAADSIDKLRKSDVYRLIDEAPDVETSKLVAEQIGKRRPDLKDEAMTSLYDFLQDVPVGGKYQSTLAESVVDRFMAEAAGITVEEYAARRKKSSPGQQEFQWITVRPNGPGTTGMPVMIDKEGTVKAGMGGKFDGQKIGEIGKGEAARGKGGDSHSKTIEEASRFSKYGPDYDRNIASAKNRYEKAKEAGHSQQMLDHLHGELSQRLEAKKKASDDRGDSKTTKAPAKPKAESASPPGSIDVVESTRKETAARKVHRSKMTEEQRKGEPSWYASVKDASQSGFTAGVGGYRRTFTVGEYGSREKAEDAAKQWSETGEKNARKADAWWGGLGEEKKRTLRREFNRDYEGPMNASEWAYSKHGPNSQQKAKKQAEPASPPGSPARLGEITGSGEFQLAQITDGDRNVGRINFGIVDRGGKKVGQIGDVFLNDSARGKRSMQSIYPQIEKRLKDQGATEIRLNTVDDAVGEKVWAPLGFKQVGGGATKTWAKSLESQPLSWTQSPTLKNEDAKPGDQKGLFGEATRAPTKKAEFTTEKARQINLIDGLNALPGQKSLFDEAGAPEDMVYKPPGKSDLFAATLADRFLEQYRTAAKPERPKTVTGNKGDRGRFVTIEGEPVFIPGPVKKTADGDYRVDNSRAKAKQARKRAAKESPNRFIPVTAVEKAAVDRLGSDDKRDVKWFVGLMKDAHDDLAGQAKAEREAMQSLLGNFGKGGSKAGAFLQSIKAKRDFDKIAGFDEMAEFARRYHPELLQPIRGESTAAGNHEEMLFQRLKRGYPEVPAKDSQEVADYAWEKHQVDQTGYPSEWGEGDNTEARILSPLDDDVVPFSAAGTARVERYRSVAPKYHPAVIERLARLRS